MQGTGSSLSRCAHEQKEKINYIKTYHVSIQKGVLSVRNCMVWVGRLGIQST